jgi:hypothetical protein
MTGIHRKSVEFLFSGMIGFVVRLHLIRCPPDHPINLPLTCAEVNM